MRQNATLISTVAPPQASASPVRVLRRKCGCGQHTSGGKCEECKKTEEKSGGDPLLQRAALNNNFVSQVPDTVPAAMQQPGRAIDRGVRSRLESSFRCDLSRVRVHSDDSAARAASAIEARAFTLGQNIWFGRNEFSPHSPAGFHLLAHEVAHTIQQGTQPPVVQRSLAIGSVDDPAEAAADRAADAAIASGSVTQLSSSAPIIRRRRIEYTADPNVRYLIEDDKKTRYKVIRTYESVVVADSPSRAPKVKPGINAKNIWLTLEWCKNQKVEAEIGVNLPEEVKSLASQLYQAISSGSSAADVAKNASLKPYLNVTITQSRSWQLAPGVHLTVNAHGDVTGGGGQIKFQKGRVKAELGAGSERVGDTGQQDTRVTATVTVDLDPPPKVECPKEKIHLEDRPVYSCVKETFVPPHDESKEIEKQISDTRERYVYFIKATDKLNPDVAGEGDLSEMNLTELRNDVGKGYKVSAISGFTSPEGPMKRAGTFEGNRALGLRRARTALGIVRNNCISRSDEACFAGDPEKMPADGGELHTLVQRGKEVEGKRLASHAVDEFEGKVPKETSDLVNNPDEGPQRSTEFQKSLEKRATPEQQAELVYQKLRRVTITLTGTRTAKEMTTTHVEGRFQKAGECPKGVAGETFLSFEE
jgi:Domain of unknown function (DUF4157)